MSTEQAIMNAWREYHEITRNLSAEQIEQVQQDEVSDEVKDSFKLARAHNAFMRAKKTRARK